LETSVKKLYEGLFLVDSAEAAANWEESLTAIKNILEKAQAEIVSIRKWDERKLAYEINRKDRGTYILCYFRAEGGKIRDIERDVQLSERIMRTLILCAEHMTQEDIEKDTPVTRTEKSRESTAQQAKEKSEESKRPIETVVNAPAAEIEQSDKEEDYSQEPEEKHEEETGVKEIGEASEP